ncbi:MAG: hypothetical protein Q9191_002531 [Dirinaria sp. TL-2023a]
MIQEVRLNHNERRLHDVLKSSLSYIFRSLSPDVDKTSSGSNVLQTITRLRQFCNHGLDMLPRNIQLLLEGLVDQEQVTRALITGPRTCDSCGVQSSVEDLSRIAFRALGCGHNLCSPCMQDERHSIPSCPLCSGLEEPHTFSSNAQDLSRYQPSSKVLALLKNLSAEQKVYPPIKSIIFSSWTKMLDLVQVALNRSGFKSQRVDGSRTSEQRKFSLEAFRDDHQYTILLASIGSTGTGLDLTAASRVHLLEPQWSPMAEQQALDRVHRMGQKHEVIATRYIVKDSIEEVTILVQSLVLV